MEIPVSSGFDPEIFPNQPSRHLLCPICHFILRDAVACTEGHIFCTTCIAEWLRQNSSCPVCRSYLDASELRRIRPINLIVDELTTSCAHQRCTWEGPLEQRNQHVLACGYRQTRCDLCAASLAAREQANHEEFECQRALVHCPCCNDNIPRGEVNYHMRHVCLKAPIPCPVSSCAILLKREQMDRHLALSATWHVAQVLQERNSAFGNMDINTLTPEGVVSHHWTLANFPESVAGVGLFSPPLALRQDEASMTIILAKGLPGAETYLSAFIRVNANAPVRCQFSIAFYKDGRTDQFLKRTPTPKWIAPNAQPIGWVFFATLEECTRWTADNGELRIRLCAQTYA